MHVQNESAGSRRLSVMEHKLIQQIREHEAALLFLQRQVVQLVIDRANEAAKENDRAEQERIGSAEPARWAAIAKTDFQTGFMALVRAVAQPVTP